MKKGIKLQNSIHMICMLMGLQTAMAALNNDEVSHNNVRLLHEAALNGDKSTVEHLLAAGVNKDTADENGWTPLHEASWNGYDDIVALLLKARAHQNVRDKIYGRTPLHAAANDGKESVVKVLLAAGVDKNAQDTVYGSTALHNAVKHAHKSVIELLIKNDADKDAQDKGGDTPLHIAVLQGNAAIVKTLLNAGANAGFKNIFGQVPLFYALQGMSRQPHHRKYHKITLMLLLVDSASLKNCRWLPTSTQDLLQTLGLGDRTFEDVLERRKILLEEEHFKTLECCLKMPKVIIMLIHKYHLCIDTHMLLFTQLRSQESMNKSKVTDRPTPAGCVLQERRLSCKEV